jgi:hypothetical protein
MKSLPHQVWVLLDVDNAKADGGYLRWFQTRQDAINFRREQNAHNPQTAKLVGPYRLRADR